MATVAGLVPFTTIDYPGCLAAVVFFKGCPLKCPFCHNPDLQNPQGKGGLLWQDILAFLSKRRSKLDGVVLSGGEPLMQSDIVDLVREIKELEFKVGLHTSGVYPDKLKVVRSYIDWVGLDIKAPWEKYPLLCGRKGMAEKVQESLHFLLDENIPFEARTTCDPTYLNPQDILCIAKTLKEKGVQTYALQKYRTFEGDQNSPSQTAIDVFFKEEALAPVKALYPHLILR